MITRLFFVVVAMATSSIHVHTAPVGEKRMLEKALVCYHAVQASYLAKAFEKGFGRGWMTLAIEHGRSRREWRTIDTGHCRPEKYVIGIVLSHRRYRNVDVYELRLSVPIVRGYASNGWWVDVEAVDQIVYAINVSDLDPPNFHSPKPDNDRRRRVWFKPLALR